LGHADLTRSLEQVHPSVIGDAFVIRKSKLSARARLSWLSNEKCLSTFLIAASLYGFVHQATAESRLPPGFETIEGSHFAPNTQFADENGQLTNLAEFRGKITIVNLWATWCGPCIKEMPSLARLATLLPADQFNVIAISQDKGGAAVTKPFLDRHRIHGLPIFFDPMGRMFRDFGGRGMPTTFIIRQDGVVISRLEGFTDWDAQNVVAYLRSLYKS
jgi:thiol-disulfide isomerase/thioredoxin